MSKMTKVFNVLYLASSGEIFGGGQISLLELLKGLNRERFRPLAICPNKGNLVDEIKELGIETQIIKMKTLRHLDIFSWIITIRRMISLIKERNIDLIHSNGFRPTIYGGIAARLTRIPLIWHVRIADRDKLLDKFLAKLATKIIVVSKAVARRFDWLRDKQEKVVVVYNGIDLEKFNPNINGERIKEEFQISYESPLVGIVGRLDWYKGHRYFLQAAKRISEVIPEVHFLIVGDGQYKEYLESLTRQLNLGGKVIFAGNRKDIPQILVNLTLFVLSSVSEGFGRSAAEAMACGKAVVATKIGGLSEIIEDGVTGSLVLPKNPTALAEAIISLLRDKERARIMGQAGRERIKNKFALQQNIWQIEETYKGILKRSKRNR